MTATDTTTITAFLLAQLDADEAAARAAMSDVGRSPWWVDGLALASGKYWVYATGEKFQHESVAAHVARHDPARVLAQVAAHRAIVELHGVRESGDYGAVCSTCTESETFPSFVEGIDTTIVSPAAWPCPTLRALASIYASAPGWREEWR